MPEADQAVDHVLRREGVRHGAIHEHVAVRQRRHIVGELGAGIVRIGFAENARGDDHARAPRHRGGKIASDDRRVVDRRDGQIERAGGRRRSVLAAVGEREGKARARCFGAVVPEADPAVDHVLRGEGRGHVAVHEHLAVGRRHHRISEPGPGIVQIGFAEIGRGDDDGTALRHSRREIARDHRRVVDIVDVERDRRGVGQAERILDRVGEARRTEIIRRRREGDIAARQADAAADRVLHGHECDRVALGIAVVAGEHRRRDRERRVFGVARDGRGDISRDGSTRENDARRQIVADDVANIRQS